MIYYTRYEMETISTFNIWSQERPPVSSWGGVYGCTAQWAPVLEPGTLAGRRPNLEPRRALCPPPGGHKAAEVALVIADLLYIWARHLKTPEQAFEIWIEGAEEV